MIALTLLGAFLRFFENTKNPVSLNIDEVAIGYNAFSILKTGKDEYGSFLPLSFKSVGDYKPPVLIYLTAPSVAIFGLNEFGVRFPTAAVGSLSIVVFYLFFRQLVEKKQALAATALLTISPWHIYYSRYASESLVATTLTVFGVYCLLKFIKGKWIWMFVSIIFLSLGMYAYHTERLFIPLLIPLILFLNKGKTKVPRKFIVFLLGSGVLLMPLLFSTFFGPDKIRAQTTLITNDVEFIRNVAVDPIQKIQGMHLQIINFFGNSNFLLFFYWIRKYLNYFQPSFLFYNGLNMTSEDTLGVGVIHLFELPWLVLGVITILKNNFKNKTLIFGWILLGLLPASLTQNEQHSLRALIILPMVLLISGIGAVSFVEITRQNLSKRLARVAYISFAVFVLWNITNEVLVYSVHFPNERGENFMEGTKQTVEYALAHKDEYKEIVFDPYRGIYGPYIVSIPHMYVLFYSQYDPFTYQTIVKHTGLDIYGFDKFTIRKIDWRYDRAQKGILFIGNPWTLPEQDLSEANILQKVYLTNGKLAFLIVTVK